MTTRSCVLSGLCYGRLRNLGMSALQLLLQALDAFGNYS
jgi:hypothetical protein